MLTALVGLSVIKAALIIAYFMHLKFERFSLFLTLFPMLILCIMLMLVFMPDSHAPAEHEDAAMKRLLPLLTLAGRATRAQCVMCFRTAAAQQERATSAECGNRAAGCSAVRRS